MTAGSYWDAIANQRLSRRKAIVSTGAASLSAAILAACGGSGSNSKSSGDKASSDKSSLIAKAQDTYKQAKRGGNLKLNMFQDVPGSLDPGFANLPNESVKIFTYSWLMQYEAGYLKATENKVSGDIGESWEFSPDGLTLTVKMRQGVKWHNKAPLNGRLMDIDDVVFSYDRLAAKGAPRGDIVNAANPNAPVLSFKAADKNTIVVKLKEPTSFITAIFAYATGVMPMLPKETDTTFDIRGDQIGTGPFVLDKYQPSVAFTYKKNPDYYDKNYPYVDGVDMPIVSEYAARLAQFKAGNIHTLFGQSRLRGEDILPTKKDVPALQIYEDDVDSTSLHTAFGWLPEGKSPWLDERMRQAYSMSIDRDAFIDAVYNVSKFKADGLPVETAWHTCINQSFRGYWMDPRDSKFGPNAKYFYAQRRRGQEAAWPQQATQTASSTCRPSPKALRTARASLTSSRSLRAWGKKPASSAKESPINYTADFIPKYRDGRGQHEGMAYKIGPGYATDAIARFVYEIYGKGGSNFYGFSASGKNDQAGDPALDSLIDKGKLETDINKRAAIALDIQRLMAQKQYLVMWPGGAGSLPHGLACGERLPDLSQHVHGYQCRPRRTLLVRPGAGTVQKGIEKETLDAEQRRQRSVVPSWAGHADGQPAAAVLDPGADARRAGRARLPAAAAAAAGREPHRLPRHLRRGRHHPELLPAPRRFDVLRPQRRRRPALRLPRLEVRRERRLRRHALGAGRMQLQEQSAHARPTRRGERNGIIWTYMGPREVPPPLPELPPNMVEDCNVWVRLEECNFMQALEGDIDTVHFGFLHAGHVVPERDSTPGSADYYALQAARGRFVAKEHEIGATYAAVRPAEADSDYWRTGHYMLPFWTMNAPGVLPMKNSCIAWVPLDDHNTMVWNIGHCSAWTRRPAASAGSRSARSAPTRWAASTLTAHARRTSSRTVNLRRKRAIGWADSAPSSTRATTT